MTKNLIRSLPENWGTRGFRIPSEITNPEPCLPTHSRTRVPLSRPFPLTDRPRSRAQPPSRPFPLTDRPRSRAQPLSRPSPLTDPPRSRALPMSRPFPLTDPPRSRAQPMSRPSPLTDPPRSRALPLSRPFPLTDPQDLGHCPCPDLSRPMPDARQLPCSRRNSSRDGPDVASRDMGPKRTDVPVPGLLPDRAQTRDTVRDRPVATPGGPWKMKATPPSCGGRDGLSRPSAGIRATGARGG
jgi:hypothetical protein